MADQRPDDQTPPLYVSPEAAAIAGEMDDPPRPAWPKVIGIISIVLASLSLVCGTGGSIMQIAGIGGGGQGFTPPPVSIGQYVYTGLNFIANLILLVGGIMLVSRKPGARAALLTHALVKLPSTVFGTWVSWTYGQKVIEAMRNSTVDQEAQFADTMGTITLGMTVCFSIPAYGWPLFLLIWFVLVKKKSSDVTVGVTEQVA